MPSLIFTQNGKETGFYNLTDAGVLLGSGHEAGLVIEAPGIDEQHCSITKEQNLFMVSDLGSREGTFVNNLKVEKPVAITTGDIVSAGPYDMIFIATSERTANDSPSMDSMEEALTVMGPVKAGPSKNAPDQWFLEIAGKDRDELLPLSDPEYILGSAPDCDIVLKGWRIPKKLVVIIKSELGVRMINLTDRKILINDIKSEMRTILSPKDTIAIGSYSLTLLHS